MGLRRQLICASLFTLSLPWLGCQYVRELETTLREGQDESLVATSSAVGASLSALQAELLNTRPDTSLPGQRIYFHRFNAAPVLDGYDEEWLSAGIQARKLQTAPHSTLSPPTLQAARTERLAALFITVPTQHIHYFNPTRTDQDYDRIEIHCISLNQTPTEFELRAAGPGVLEPLQVKGDRRLSDHRVKGILRENQQGYQAELVLPAELCAHGFGLRVLTQSGIDEKNTFSSFAPASPPPAPLFQLQALNQFLDRFSQPGLRLTIVNKESAIIARAGSLQLPNAHGTEGNTLIKGLLQSLYRIAVADQHYPDLPSTAATGFYPSTLDGPVSASLSRATLQHFQYRRDIISAAYTPITFDDAEVPGYVIAERNASGLERFTQSALNQLFVYSFLITLSVIIVLVSYASWLSFRIRQLSRVARETLDDRGQLIQQFPVSTLPDEIGDLSRSFATLHARLRDYTQYLGSLASKLSHELRTPLAIVSSSLDNLEQHAPDAQAQTYLSRAKDGIHRLRALINAMNEATRIEQAVEASDKTDVDLVPLLRALVPAYQDVYTECRLSLEIAPSLEACLVSASEELLVQMLDKLVANANDFSPSDGPVVLRLSKTKQEALISLSNQGPPLPNAFSAQIFHSLVSIRQASHTSAGHLGLGLYIVKLICEGLGGRVHAENLTDEQGVIFHIALPLAKPGV